ncbi:MAG: hypothetical protein J6Q52_05635 [Clostridia bacterium]|nr:hypothetical protein [Clostridia bacterium]
MKPKVVFTFVEAGMGHIMPATGLADAFESKYGDKCEVVRLKIFSQSPHECVQKYGQSLADDVKKLGSSDIYAWGEWFFSELIGSKNTLKFLDNLYKDARELILDGLEELNPDLIFSTYYSPSHFAIQAREQGRIDSIIGSYSPDPEIYAAWDRRGDFFITNNERAYRQAIDKGCERVYQIPFIYRKEIEEASSISKEDMRDRLGLPRDKFTVLLSDGAYGQKNLVRFTKALLDSELPISIVSICGKNQQAYEELKSLKPKSEDTYFLPLGFATNMLEYLRSADMFAGKGGSNAINEAFYFGLPVVVSAFANMLEKQTATYFLIERGLGKIIKNPNKFVAFVRHLLDNPSEVDSYREKLVSHHDSTGASQGADIIYQMLKEKYPNL